MNRPARQRLLLQWLVLLLLLLRALIPAGFMLEGSGGSLELRLCAAGFAAPAAIDYQDAGGAHRTGSADENCPFGHALIAPPPSFDFSAPFVGAKFHERPTRSAPTVVTNGPLRFVPARGPPTLT